MPTTLSKLRFKKVHKDLMNARAEFRSWFVSVSYNPNWAGNAGSAYGDGTRHWEVAYGRVGSEPKTWTVLGNQNRNSVNALLRNVYIKGMLDEQSQKTCVFGCSKDVYRGGACYDCWTAEHSDPEYPEGDE